MAKKTKAQLAEIEQAKADLRALLKPGDTIHLVLRHCSKSGMQREITPIFLRDGDPRYITRNAALVLDCRVGKHDGVVVGGCGMDMGFWLVYSLAATLFPAPPYTEDARQKTGGYSLTHRWL